MHLLHCYKTTHNNVLLSNYKKCFDGIITNNNRLKSLHNLIHKKHYTVWAPTMCVSQSFDITFTPKCDNNGTNAKSVYFLYWYIIKSYCSKTSRNLSLPYVISISTWFISQITYCLKQHQKVAELANDALYRWILFIFVTNRSITCNFNLKYQFLQWKENNRSLKI